MPASIAEGTLWGKKNGPGKPRQTPKAANSILRIQPHCVQRITRSPCAKANDEIKAIGFSQREGRHFMFALVDAGA
jgi:hypothetical protein